MNIVERDVACTIVSFLLARGDRIACDAGLIELRSTNGTLSATLGSDTFEVIVHVQRTR